ncbi:hypothetical protein BCV70DRAFT_59172 [Testicularia cyperi]|uniref:C2H2-type domain-containing protein n=1 Tax=Testicularia cyperi TaxID=1882483 RepID=A0A317XWF4_9BASI|nr:hypothetical protein BCV70DRAFT_59172 [Testicularia cyperi]
MLQSDQAALANHVLSKSGFEDYSTYFSSLPSLDYLQSHTKIGETFSLETSLLSQQPSKAAPALKTVSAATPKILTHTEGAADTESVFSSALTHLAQATSASNCHAASIADPDSDLAQMSGANYQFEAHALHQQPAGLTNDYSSPALGALPFGAKVNENVSPALPSQNHGYQWSSDTHTDPDASRKSSPYSNTYFQTTLAPKDETHSQANPSLVSPDSFPAPSSAASHYFHRASISGPLMDPPSSSTANTYPTRQDIMPAPVSAPPLSAAPAPAPPRVHGLAAWENASGAARPHTADGLFGHFGIVPGGGGGSSGCHEGSSASEISVLNQTGSSSSSRPYTPAGPSMAMDAYYQNRRFSLPDAEVAGPVSSSGKIFSYMPPMDDGGVMGSHSSMGMGMGLAGNGYAGHYFSGLGGFNANASKKRPRRRYDEIERLYPCSWPGCNKSYGTLNHLNAHVAMQKHGSKRSPAEFKDMRKAWRKQKKEEEQRRQARQTHLAEQGLARGELARPTTASAYGHAVNAVGAGGNPATGANGLASAAPIGPPPALGSYGGPLGAPPALGGSGGLSHHGSNLSGQLSRYSMSSVSDSPSSASQPFFYSATSTSPSVQGSIQHSHAGHQPQGNLSQTTNVHSSVNDHGLSSDSRPYTAAGPGAATNAQYPHPSLGAYLSVHRGSI